MKIHKLEFYLVDINNENLDWVDEIKNEYRGILDWCSVECRIEKTIKMSYETFDKTINLPPTTIEDYRKLFDLKGSE
jgi:hypothetical protein